ncbi:MAG: hypothetical protein QM500_13065 [Methylococcales bacterium]
MKKLNIEYFINKIVEKILSVITYTILLGGTLGGIGVFIKQIIIYLKSGIWEEQSFLNIFLVFGGKYKQWAEAPTDWHGMHKVFEIIPLSLTLIVFGLIIGVSLLTKLETYIDENERLFKS